MIFFEIIFISNNFERLQNTFTRSYLEIIYTVTLVMGILYKVACSNPLVAKWESAIFKQTRINSKIVMWAITFIEFYEWVFKFLTKNN